MIIRLQKKPSLAAYILFLYDFFGFIFIGQMEYILKQSITKDGKLLAIGHSMGGILLYSMLSRFGKFPAFDSADLP